MTDRAAPARVEAAEAPVSSPPRIVGKVTQLAALVMSPPSLEGKVRLHTGPVDPADVVLGTAKSDW